jgi:hypothetical protein
MILISLIASILLAKAFCFQGNIKQNVTLSIVSGVALPMPTTTENAAPFFGGDIDAVAVNPCGDVFAADFRGDRPRFACFNRTKERTANPTSQGYPIVVGNHFGQNLPVIAGARFLSDDRLLLTGEDTPNFGESMLMRHRCRKQTRSPDKWHRYLYFLYSSEDAATKRHCYLHP